MSIALHTLPRTSLQGNRLAIPPGGGSFANQRVTAAIKALMDNSRAAALRRWTAAVTRLVSDMRSDLASQLRDYLASPVAIDSPLRGLSIGEIGVVYEAILALSDHHSRRSNGQYFTPDDVAMYMASQAARFPTEGHWLDPCCGVGNLAWHLAGASKDPGAFVRDQLTLIDLDPTALQTAVALLVASYAAPNDTEALTRLARRSRRRNFLAKASLPAHDFVIVNPPYARAAALPGYRSGTSRDLYAYFLERVATESRGFIAITPASYLSGLKFAPLREVLSDLRGGDVLVFDNVPDTCFRGYKYGSTNTSKTNFVRAAITVSAPKDDGWLVTPILRWASNSRKRMFEGAREYLVPRRIGPDGEWAKVMPGTEAVWEALGPAKGRLRDLVSKSPTDFVLRVASTPRYYISATKRDLDRGSKHVLYFRTAADRDRAYLLLNSSLPYWWWRTLDGGVTLPIRNLLSLPLPTDPGTSEGVVRRLEASERTDMVTKLNAGRINENVRRPRALVEEIDALLLGKIPRDFAMTYASDMFVEEK